VEIERIKERPLLIERIDDQEEAVSSAQPEMVIEYIQPPTATPEKPEGFVSGVVKPTAKAIPRVGGAIAGGALLFPLAGVAGGLRALLEGVDAGTETINEILSQPNRLIKTDEEAESLSIIMKPIEWIQYAAKFWGDKAYEATDNPNVGASVATAVEAIALMATPKLAGKLRSGIKARNPSRVRNTINKIHKEYSKRAVSEERLQNKNGVMTKEDMVFDRDGVINADATVKNLPNIPKGHVRLYRAESPTVKFDDIFQSDSKFFPELPKNKPGKFYTDDLTYADYYRHAYNEKGDAVIKYIDVPQNVAQKARWKNGEYIVNEKSSDLKVEGIYDDAVELIRERRANIDLATYETNKFVHELNQVTTKAEREAIPFVIEKTQVPKELGRPDLLGVDLESLKPIAKKVSQHFDKGWEKVKKHIPEMSDKQIENYVTHIWDIPKNKKAQVTNWFITKNKFLNKRFIQPLKRVSKSLVYNQRF
jgi:hypothetical protein